MPIRLRHVASTTAVTFALILAVACTKSADDAPASGSTAKAGASASASAAAAFTPPDPAKVGMECKKDFDCPSLDYKSSCKFACQRTPGTPDTEAGYCQLQTITATVGAGPCDGYRMGVTRVGGGAPATKTAAMYFCDVNEGVYCDKKSHVCAAIKALGAACGDGDKDCGKDGVCDSASKVCVAAAAVGESCKDRQCVSGAYCDKEKKCAARKADGEACGESEQCASLRCVAGEGPPVCKPATPPTACAL